MNRFTTDATEERRRFHVTMLRLISQNNRPIQNQNIGQGHNETHSQDGTPNISDSEADSETEFGIQLPLEFIQNLENHIIANNQELEQRNPNGNRVNNIQISSLISSFLNLLTISFSPILIMRVVTSLVSYITNKNRFLKEAMGLAHSSDENAINEEYTLLLRFNSIFQTELHLDPDSLKLRVLTLTVFFSYALLMTFFIFISMGFFTFCVVTALSRRWNLVNRFVSKFFNESVGVM